MKKFTEEDLLKKKEDIAALQRQGLKQKEICERLGISRQTYYNYRDPEYDTRERFSSEEVAIIKEKISILLAEGLKKRDICKRLGLTSTKYDNYFRESRGDNSLRGYSKETRRILKEG